METRVCLVNLATKLESQPRKYKGRRENRSAQPAEVKLTGLERNSQVEGGNPRFG